jgi:hypothetical protein
MHPQTLDEWKDYIATLTGAALRSKAIAANSVTFVRVLEDEGMSPSDITAVLEAFAHQFDIDDQEPPSRSDGTYIEYALLTAPSYMPAPVEPLA